MACNCAAHVREAELLAEIERIRSTALCGYCATEIPRASGQIDSHIRVCEKHPLSAALKQIDRLRPIVEHIAARGCQVIRVGTMRNCKTASDGTIFATCAAREALAGEAQP